MGIYAEIKCVCFTLKADTEQEINKSNELIAKLKKTFGEKAIEQKPLQTIITVEINNALGWIISNDKQNGGKDTLYIQVNDKNGSIVTSVAVGDLDSVTRL